MVTSESREWTATAHVYSGRPDPEWQVPAALVERLMALWTRLPLATRPPAMPPALGYRGVSIVGPGDTRLTGYHGTIVREAPDSRTVRVDEHAEWERALLESAPEGLLPPIDLL